VLVACAAVVGGGCDNTPAPVEPLARSSIYEMTSGRLVLLARAEISRDSLDLSFRLRERPAPGMQGGEPVEDRIARQLAAAQAVGRRLAVIKGRLGPVLPHSLATPNLPALQVAGYRAEVRDHVRTIRRALHDARRPWRRHEALASSTTAYVWVVVYHAKGEMHELARRHAARVAVEQQRYESAIAPIKDRYFAGEIGDGALQYADSRVLRAHLERLNLLTKQTRAAHDERMSKVFGGAESALVELGRLRREVARPGRRAADVAAAATIGSELESLRGWLDIVARSEVYRGLDGLLAEECEASVPAIGLDHERWIDRLVRLADSSAVSPTPGLRLLDVTVRVPDGEIIARGALDGTTDGVSMNLSVACAPGAYELVVGARQSDGRRVSFRMVLDWTGLRDAIVSGRVAVAGWVPPPRLHGEVGQPGVDAVGAWSELLAAAHSLEGPGAARSLARIRDALLVDGARAAVKARQIATELRRTQGSVDRLVDVLRRGADSLAPRYAGQRVDQSVTSVFDSLARQGLLVKQRVTSSGSRGYHIFTTRGFVAARGGKPGVGVEVWVQKQLRDAKGGRMRPDVLYIDHAKLAIQVHENGRHLPGATRTQAAHDAAKLRYLASREFAKLERITGARFARRSVDYAGWEPAREALTDGSRRALVHALVPPPRQPLARDPVSGHRGPGAQSTAAAVELLPIIADCVQGELDARAAAGALDAHRQWLAAVEAATPPDARLMWRFRFTRGMWPAEKPPFGWMQDVDDSPVWVTRSDLQGQASVLIESARERRRLANFIRNGTIGRFNDRAAIRTAEGHKMYARFLVEYPKYLDASAIQSEREAGALIETRQSHEQALNDPSLWALKMTSNEWESWNERMPGVAAGYEQHGDGDYYQRLDFRAAVNAYHAREQVHKVR
jgi:hypothetical protein